MDVALDSPIDYILEVDLEYPQHLHDAHSDLPFCPTRDKPPVNVKTSSSPHYTIKNVTLFIIATFSSTRHGLWVTKIHRVLQFAQCLWLRDYIQLNTDFRICANNDFKKNLYKLMNNAVFGKKHRKYVQSRQRTTLDALGREIRRGGNDRKTKFS